MSVRKIKSRTKLAIFFTVIILIILNEAEARSSKGSSSKGSSSSRPGSRLTTKKYKLDFIASTTRKSFTTTSTYGWNIKPTTTQRNFYTTTPKIGWDIKSDSSVQNFYTTTPKIGWDIKPLPVGPPIYTTKSPPSFNPGILDAPTINDPYPTKKLTTKTYRKEYLNKGRTTKRYDNYDYDDSYESQKYTTKVYRKEYLNKAQTTKSYNVHITNNHRPTRRTITTRRTTTTTIPYPTTINPNQAYGSSFGGQEIPSNTYIYNNYYTNQRSGGSGFLANALFFGAGMGSGYMLGNRKRWDENDDRRWRRTTKAPYFENKIPGEDKILPASAVIGAATAFRLVSLLPLKVPANKPLMYCSKNTYLLQSQIQLNNENIYRCANTTLEISCPKTLENGTSIDECKNTAVNCDLNPVENESKNIYCTNGTLLSKNPIFCNSSTILNLINVNETTILNCYEGELPNHYASFLPTTTLKPATTTEKSLSIKARMHIFLLTLVGKKDVLEKTPVPQTTQSSWIPQALTMPPEETTTAVPKVWVKVTQRRIEGSSKTEEVLERASPEMEKYFLTNGKRGTVVKNGIKYQEVPITRLPKTIVVDEFPEIIASEVSSEDVISKSKDDYAEVLIEKSVEDSTLDDIDSEWT